MSADAHVVLGDLGGTNLRLARLHGGAPVDIREYPVSEWSGLAAALKDYGADMRGARFVLSFAKKCDAQNIYRLDQAHKQAAWEFSVDALKAECGFGDVRILHDFYAMALALFYGGDVFVPLKAGASNENMCAVIGVGTGIGHALVDRNTRRVYDTFGGHFPPCAVTAEQKDVLARLQAGFTESRSFIFEEILSGRGLKALYAVCDGQGDVANGEGPALDTACRLFAEFLGLYINVVCTAGHAFGGVYLTGGVIQKLAQAGHLDVDAVLKNARLSMVPIVDASFAAMPLYRARDEHTGLYGLAVYAGNEHA